MTATALIAFLVAAGLLTITPGLDTALVLRTAGVEGPRKAALAGLGIALGCLAWGVVVALGLGVLLQASELAYTVLRWAGAAYLVWLGITLLRSRREGIGEVEGVASGAAGAAWFWRGLLTNLLNPKVGIFYVSFLPQFVPAGADVPGTTILLAAIHAGLGLLWFAALILATRPIAAALRKPGAVRLLDQLSGGLFLLFGARLALVRD
jgi:threonine/homoserine/homoserine lactone efflux protein